MKNQRISVFEKNEVPVRKCPFYSKKDANKNERTNESREAVLNETHWISIVRVPFAVREAKYRLVLNCSTVIQLN